MERGRRGQGPGTAVARTDPTRWMATVIELMALATALSFAWLQANS